jgi:hypothetical protein
MLMSRRLRAFVSMILLPVMLSMTVIPVLPDLAMAQSSSGTSENACLEAQMSAKASTSGGMWFIVGCFGGVIGLLVAYIYEPNPPATSLLGKSADYVARYTDCFKQQAKSVQTKNAITGCLVSAALYVLAWVIIAATATTVANDPYYYGY